jgi:hypothetical protein
MAPDMKLAGQSFLLDIGPLAPKQCCQNSTPSHLHFDQLGLGAGSSISILRQNLSSQILCGLEFACSYYLYRKHDPSFSWKKSFVLLDHPRPLSLSFCSQSRIIVKMRATAFTLIAAATLATAQLGSIPSCMCRKT